MTSLKVLHELHTGTFGDPRWGKKNKVNKIKIKVNKRLLSLPRTHIRMGVYMDVVKWRTGLKCSGAGTEPRDQVREAIKYRSGVCVAVQTKTK